MQPARWPQIVALCTLCSLAGCSKGDDDDDSATMDLPEAGMPKCPAGTPDFAVGPDAGLSAKGKNGLYQARLIDAQPIAPIVKGDDNDLTVQISDANGEPADVELAAACIYMPPPHGHGLPPLMGIEKLSEPGQFKLKQVDFRMDGAWQIQLAIDPAAEGEKQVAYTSCDKNGVHPSKDYAVLPLCMPIRFH